MLSLTASDCSSPPQISVVIAAHNAVAHLRICLASLQRSVFRDFECIVVDDGSTDDIAAIGLEFDVVMLRTGGRRGPAYARNMGAMAAKGEFLLFIDSDVCVRPDTLARVARQFAEDRELDAVIGSYDDDPGARDFISRYRNLMHCYVHQHSKRRASTFWSGCGAIRRTVFEQVKGFDEGYTEPSVEDIELGYRLAASKHKLALDPGLMVKHLKHWNFTELVRTDILRRGIPWTELILRDRSMPNDLNLKLSQRLSVVAVFLAVVMAGGALIRSGQAFGLSLLTLLFLALVPAAASSGRKSWPSRALPMVGGAAAVVLLSKRNHVEWLSMMMLAAYILAVAGERVAPGLMRRVARIALGGYLVFLALSIVILIPQHSAAGGFYVSVLLVALLNLDFYLFLAARMGKLQALAAFPFHILFFLYSGIAFVLGALKYVVSPQPSMFARKADGRREASAGRVMPEPESE